MADMNYEPIEKLTEELSSKVKDLKSGKLSHNEVNELVKTAQEVYNRMVILEFQIYEKGDFSNKESKEILKEEELTDDKEEEIVMPEFNLNMTEEVEIDVNEELENLEIEPVSEPEVIEEPVLEATADIAENMTEVPLATVAERFENAPISDISKGYSLNEKFQFMRVFTGNNSQQFSALVETLNNSSNLNTALQLFENSVSKPEGEDMAVYDSFKELIIRRFS